MAYVTIIVMFALMQYLYFGVAVGRARTRHGVAAPAVSGDENFERFHRAHQNTLEQLIVFIPAIYAAGYYAHGIAAAGVGVVFLLGRADYFRSYIADPQSRGRGMMVTMACSVVLLAAALVGAMRVLLMG